MIATETKNKPHAAAMPVLIAVAFSHLLNDTLQALIPSIYPLLKDSFTLSFTQLGMITFVFQCTASVLQPLVGLVTDRRPMPFSLSTGMALTLLGLLLFSQAPNYHVILIATVLVGLGSAIFHPEASRIAHMAAGTRRGFAQSLFQLGGNAGSALGPLLAAFFIAAYGLGRLGWFSLLALLGVMLLWKVGVWQKANMHRLHPARTRDPGLQHPALHRKKVILALSVLVALIFSKYIYLVSLTNYYTFYLSERFGVSIASSQLYLFLFLLATAAGTIIGGPVGDQFGRKKVIWFSILGTAPFSLLLPHVGLMATAILSVMIGLILASAFSAILVYAQELVPGKVGLIAGLFFGLAFGVAGIGSAALGFLADRTGIEYVFHLCAFLPLIGLLTIFLPDTRSLDT